MAEAPDDCNKRSRLNTCAAVGVCQGTRRARCLSFLTGLDGFPMITEVLKKEDERVNFGGVGIRIQPIKNARQWPPCSMPRNCPRSVAIHYLPINMRHLKFICAAHDVLEKLRGVNAAGKKRVASTQ